MYLNEWSLYEYKMLCAYDEYYDKAIDALEEMGREGKMMLAALLREKGQFSELYENMVMDSVDSTDYDN